MIGKALGQRGVGAERVARLHGSMTARARDREVLKFRNQPSCDLFLISTKAGGARRPLQSPPPPPPPPP
eukprot:COSAG05_NODE_4316_length_1569_cov_1.809524_3_plen_68_part_01